MIKSKALEKFFWILLSAFGLVVASSFSYIAYKVDTMSDSMVQLNKNIAVIIEKGEHRDRIIYDHEMRIRRMEQL